MSTSIGPDGSSAALGDHSDARVTAFGRQLIEVHGWLREELARVRAEVGAFLDGAGRTPAGSDGHGGSSAGPDGYGRNPNGFAARGGSSPGARELRAHCSAFCSAVTRHHTGEDGGAFVVLAERFPELRPTLELLKQDHRMVEDILRRLQELLDGLGAGGGADPAAEARRVLGELDGLAAILESHFVYEERRIVDALNALRVPSWDASTPAFLRREPVPPPA
ncbi:hemerythrin domain-containing protein [Sphaerisporangium album]|uniref:Hemerythrin domain-containing protein n=2 Tax=Sphaerisporangium album TaxID=509200 RepID=A0A367FS42_9ACTN|nr:hemerythrin domain-containing protein [Sphaerisporangium album]